MQKNELIPVDELTLLNLKYAIGMSGIYSIKEIERRKAGELSIKAIFHKPLNPSNDAKNNKKLTSNVLYHASLNRLWEESELTILINVQSTVTAQSDQLSALTLPALKYNIGMSNIYSIKELGKGRSEELNIKSIMSTPLTPGNDAKSHGNYSYRDLPYNFFYQDSLNRLWEEGELISLSSTQGAQGTQGTAGITGPQGVQGRQGIQGVQGRQGIQGIQGSQGIQGIEGAQGIQGIEGAQGTYQGAQGTQGIQGITGSQGVTGSQGIQGIAGSQGIIGSQGITGSQGTQGTQGQQGIAGSQGIQGIQGTQGITGSQGVTGSQGIQGTDGTQGITGSQGTQGQQGIQGRQGVTGSQGIQGVQGRQGIQGITGSQATTNVIAASIVSSIVNTDASAGAIFDVTATENFTLANPTNSTDGKSIRWRIKQDGSGSRTVTLGGKFKIPSSATNPLAFSTAANVTDLLAATYCLSRDEWDIIAFVAGY